MAVVVTPAAPGATPAVLSVTPVTPVPPAAPVTPAAPAVAPVVTSAVTWAAAGLTAGRGSGPAPFPCRRIPRTPLAAISVPAAATAVIRTSPGRYAASVAAGESTRLAPEASITAVTTASTTAPPTWNEVWNRLAARPCSASGTPAVAATLSEENPRPKARPMSSGAGSITAGESGRAPGRRKTAQP